MNLLGETISSILKCLQIPYAIVAFFLLLGKRKEKYLFLLFLFLMFIWRVFITVKSSRYCVTLILFFIVLSSLYLKTFISHVNYRYITLAFIACCCILYNVTKTYSGFRNTYFFDIKEDLKRILTSSDNVVFYSPKDEYRISNHSEREYVFRFDPSFENFFYNYSNSYNNSIFVDYLKTNSFYVISEKSCSNTLKDDRFNSKKIIQYRTNKDDGVYSIYYLPKLKPDYRNVLFPKLSIEERKTIEDGVLFTYNPFLDFYVFRNDNSFIFVLGTHLEKDTEIIYQTYTNSIDLLNESRRQYGFDNLGHWLNGHEFDNGEAYYVFSRKIPDRYPINQVRLGIKGRILWSQYFPL